MEAMPAKTFETGGRVATSWPRPCALAARWPHAHAWPRRGARHAGERVVFRPYLACFALSGSGFDLAQIYLFGVLFSMAGGHPVLKLYTVSRSKSILLSVFHSFL